MATLAIKNELLHHLNRLPTDMQCQVLQFARALEMSVNTGVPGKSLVSFAGSIPTDDLTAITQAVEEGCERVEKRSKLSSGSKLKR